MNQGACSFGDFSFLFFFFGCRSVLFWFSFSRCIFAPELGLYHLVALFEYRVYVHVCDMTSVRPRDVQRSHSVVKRTQQTGGCPKY